MNNPLQALAIDYWYKAVLAISTAVLLLSLVMPFHGIDNKTAAILSLGGVLLGLGEWINHPLQEAVGMGFKLSGYPRSNRLLGVLLDIAGLALITKGLYIVISA